VTIENMCGSEDEPPSRIASEGARGEWSCVHDKLCAFWFSQRETLNQQHRQWLWVALIRIKFMLHRTAPEHREVHNAAFARERHIQTTHNRIPQQSVTEVWRTLYALMLTWCTLPITDDVVMYSEALATQTGRLAWLASPDRRIFDHHAYCTTVDAFENAGILGAGNEVVFTGAQPRTVYCINDAFLVETERIFFVLLRDIEQWKKVYRGGLGYKMHTAPRARSYENVLRWIEDAISVEARREGVAEVFEKRVYARRALPGEIERLKEKDPNQLHDAYNAIASFRPEVIDATSMIIAKDTTVEDLITHARGWAPGSASASAGAGAGATAPEDGPETPLQARRRVAEEAQRNGDATDVVLAAAGLTLDGAFASDNVSFMGWFSTTDLPIPSMKRALPMLVHVGGGWHVARGDSFYTCTTIVDAVACWITMLCDDPDTLPGIAHVAPNVDVFFASYRAIIGEVSPAERARLAMEAATLQSMSVQLPACYA